MMMRRDGKIEEPDRKLEHICFKTSNGKESPPVKAIRPTKAGNTIKN